MKRLKFKKPFNGFGNALKLIPEGYRTEGNEFEMTDGKENYRMKWEDGKASILNASDKSVVNEDINRLKELMGYKPETTLGLVEGEDRVKESLLLEDFAGIKANSPEGAWAQYKKDLEPKAIADKKKGNDSGFKQGTIDFSPKKKDTMKNAPDGGNFEDDARKQAASYGAVGESEGGEKLQTLIKYFSTIWSKDELGNEVILRNPELKAKYGKYLAYSTQEWANSSEEELMALWNNWSKDEADIN